VVVTVTLGLLLPAHGARPVGSVGVVCLISDPPRDPQYRQAPHRCWLRLPCGEGWCTLQMERLRWDIWNRRLARGTGIELSDPRTRLHVKLTEPVHRRCGRRLVFSVITLRHPLTGDVFTHQPYTCVAARE
jgi:hypothetical protein